MIRRIGCATAPVAAMAFACLGPVPAARAQSGGTPATSPAVGPVQTSIPAPAPAVGGPQPAAGAGQDPPRISAIPIPAGTPVRLMILKEITSRTAVIGQRFKLRVNEPIFIDGKSLVPVGATAWGEIVSFDAAGAVGRGGKLGIRLLYVELPDGQLPLRGDAAHRGDGNGAGVAMAVIGFGLLGLLTAGDSARFKGGEELTAYVDALPAAAPPVALTPPAPESSATTATPAPLAGALTPQPVAAPR